MIVARINWQARSPMLASAKLPKIFACFGNNVRKQLHLDTANILTSNANVCEHEQAERLKSCNFSASSTGYGLALVAHQKRL